MVSRFPTQEIFPGQIEDYYLRRVGALPEATQRLMLVAAADPVGDATLLWRAPRRSGSSREAASRPPTRACSRSERGCGSGIRS